MSTRAGRRGKVTPLNSEVLDVVLSHKSSPIMTAIAEKEKKRTRKTRKCNSTLNSFNKENEFIEPMLVQQKVHNNSELDKQPDILKNLEIPRRFTRSVKVLPESDNISDTGSRNIAGRRKKKVVEVGENLPNVPLVTLPMRKLTRRNKQESLVPEIIPDELSNINSNNGELSKTTNIPVSTQEASKKKKQIRIKNTTCVDEIAQIISNNLPSKRGSTESSNVLEFSNAYTRNKITKIIDESDDSNESNMKESKKSKKSKQKKNNDKSGNDCEDVSDVLRDKNLSVASDETSYHSANGSLGLHSNIDKENCSFSSAIVLNNKKNSSLTNTSNTMKDVVLNAEIQNTSSQNRSDQLNETYPILPLDSSQSDSEQLTKYAGLKSLKSKKFPRISGIEEFEEKIIPIPVMQRQGTYIKENSFDNSHGGAINISDSFGTDRSSRRKVLSASSPCKIFTNKSTTNSDSFPAVKTPMKPICQAVSVGSAGQTPMPLRKSSGPKETFNTTPSKGVKVMNRTHSLEKPLKQNSNIFNDKLVDSSAAKNRGRVAFRSPNRRQVSFAAHSGKIIKSSMKGSTNSFLLTDSLRPGSRKRSITQDNIREGKIRKMTAKDLNISASRLPIPKTPISEAKSRFNGRANIATRVSTPAKLQLIKPAAPLSRSKMPDFASLHKKQFEQMESLVQNKARKEERAKQLLFPTLPLNSPRVSRQELKTFFKELPSIRNPIYTRFGYKVSEAAKNVTVGDSGEIKPAAVALPRSAIKTRMTKTQVRNVVMREESMSLVEKKRIANREYVKGIRTNRRFDLQMKSRNLAV